LATLTQFDAVKAEKKILTLFFSSAIFSPTLAENSDHNIGPYNSDVMLNKLVILCKKYPKYELHNLGNCFEFNCLCASSCCMDRHPAQCYGLGGTVGPQ
jgi:hypothetical protein